MRLVLLLVLACLAPPAAAGTLELDREPRQGSVVFGTAEPGAKVRLGERAVRVSAEGRFVIGFGRDAPGRAVLRVIFPDGTKDERTLEIARRTYNIQRIDGLPPNMVTPSAEELVRIREENAKIAVVRKVDRPEALFESGFAWPAIGPISGVYGSQRILNFSPRRPHFGVYVSSPEVPPITAPSDVFLVIS